MTDPGGPSAPLRSRLAAGLVLSCIAFPALGAETTVAALAKQTHFHGLSVIPGPSERLYLATHHGLFSVAADGGADRVSSVADDFMGFTPHPADRSTLFASGHPQRGGNLGFLQSADGGQTWAKLSDGVGGPVDFHQIEVSPADPQVIWGVFGGLQRSNDGGRTWRRVVGQLPDGIQDLAGSKSRVDTLYAATQSGVMRTLDGGASWRSVYVQRARATMVQQLSSGELLAYVVGVGLIRAPSEADLSWQRLGDLGDEVIVHLAQHPSAPSLLYAATMHAISGDQSILKSTDGGRRWTRLGQ